MAVTRSRSGKIVQEHYDELAQIWKGSPATDKLGIGISSNSSLNTSCTSRSSSAPGTPSDDPLDTSQEHIEEEPNLDDSGADDEENDAGMNGNVICKFSLIILHVYSFMVTCVAGSGVRGDGDSFMGTHTFALVKGMELDRINIK